MRNHMLRAAAGLKKLTFINNYGSVTNLTTYTFNSVDFGAADSTREIFIVGFAGTTTTRTLSTATIGGITATVINQGAGATGSSFIAFATVPTGTSGTVVLTLSGSASHILFSCFVINNRTNIGQTAVTTTPTASATQSSPFSSSITMPNRGFGLGLTGTSSNLVSPASNNFILHPTNTTISAEGTRGYPVSFNNFNGSERTFTQSLTWTSPSTISHRSAISVFNG